jgi:hypothetical protein
MLTIFYIDVSTWHGMRRSLEAFFFGFVFILQVEGVGGVATSTGVLSFEACCYCR